MRKFLLFFALLTAGLCQGRVYTIMQATDTHVMHPDLLQVRGQAFIDDVGYNQTMHEQSYGIFLALMDSVKTHHPDIFLLSGDIAKDGEYIGQQLVADSLESLRQMGIKVYVIPGNHDVRNPFGRIYMGDSCTYARTTTETDFRQIYANFGFNQAVSEDDSTMSYMVYPYPDLAILCVDANDFNRSIYNPEGHPDNMKDTLSCHSFISEKTLRWIERAAREADSTGHYIIMQEHYPINVHYPVYSKALAENITNLADSLVLTNDALADRLMTAGVEVSFSGHVHAGDICYREQAATGKRLWDVNSNSTAQCLPAFRVCELDSATGILSIRTQTISNYMVDTLTLPEYAYAYSHSAELEASMKNDNRRYYSYVEALKNSSYGVIASAFALPNSGTELADMLDTLHLADDFKEYFYLHALGNEQTHDYQPWLDSVQSHLDKGVMALCRNQASMAAGAKMLAKAYLGYSFDSLTINMFGPEMRNLTYYDTTRVTDDFTVRIPLHRTIPSAPTAIEDASSSAEEKPSAVKYFDRGRIIILRDGRRYDLLGRPLE